MGKLDVQRVLVKNENIGLDVRWLMTFPRTRVHSPFIKDVLLVSLDIPHNSAPHLCFTALFASTCVLNTLPFSISGLCTRNDPSFIADGMLQHPPSPRVLCSGMS